MLDRDPYHHSCLPIHLTCLVELKDSSGLFYMAHKLVDSYPEKAIAWFAVGCYYFLIQNHQNARRYFGKASQLDPQFGPAWLGFGHAFAAEGEHDQAMAAYCTAARLMSGCHLPLLYIGMEHVASHNTAMARQCFLQAHAICGACVLQLFLHLTYSSRNVLSGPGVTIADVMCTNLWVTNPVETFVCRHGSTGFA